MQLLQLMQLIYIFLIDQIVNFLLCWFYWICICIYVYIGIFQQTICCFRTAEAFCRSFKEMKKSFLVSHFTPGCGENETVPSALNKQFLQYNLSIIQLLMYVFFYHNNMIYLSVQFYALCPVLSGVILNFSIKCLIMPHTTLEPS